MLVSPPRFIAGILELVDLPPVARWTFFGAVIFNVLTSMAFEHYGTPAVSHVIGKLFELRRRQRVRDGKIYKTVEGGMR